MHYEHMTNTSTLKPITIIPAYQPGRALIDSTNRLLAAQFYVVVVDDGSQKKYAPIFNLLNENVHLVRHAANQGKGAALKTGYDYIRNHFENYIVITADADGQHRVRDIRKIAQSYRTDSHALILGVRSFGGRKIPLRSRFGNVVTRWIFSAVTKYSVSDTQTGLRAFDDSMIDFMITVPGERFEYEMDVLLACSRRGIPLIEVPIETVYENNNQSSHFKPISDSVLIYKEVFKFASSSLVGFIIDYGLFLLLTYLTGSWSLAASVTFANIGARFVSAGVNFTFNRYIIFKYQGNVYKDLVAYMALACGILVGNTIVLNFLIVGIRIDSSVAKIITELSFFVVSYMVQKHCIFKKNRRARV